MASVQRKEIKSSNVLGETLLEKTASDMISELLAQELRWMSPINSWLKLCLTLIKINVRLLHYGVCKISS